MSGISRRHLLSKAATAAPMVAIGVGTAGAAIRDDLPDAQLQALIEACDRARTASKPHYRAFNAAEEYYLAAVRSGMPRDQAKRVAGLEAARRNQDAAEDEVIAAENAVRDYVPSSWNGLLAKAKAMSGWEIVIDNADDLTQALLRDILNVAGEALS